LRKSLNINRELRPEEPEAGGIWSGRRSALDGKKNLLDIKQNVDSYFDVREPSVQPAVKRQGRRPGRRNKEN
jgi:hypothetical protein